MATHSCILAGKSYELGILAGYSLWGCKESDTTEASQPTHNQDLKRLYDVVKYIKNERYVWEKKKTVIYAHPLKNKTNKQTKSVSKSQ